MPKSRPLGPSSKHKTNQPHHTNYKIPVDTISGLFYCNHMTTTNTPTLKQLREGVAAIAAASTRSATLKVSSLGGEFGHAAFTLKAEHMCRKTRADLDIFCSRMNLAIHSKEIRGSRYDWHYFYILVPRDMLKNPDRYTFSTDARYVSV